MIFAQDVVEVGSCVYGCSRHSRPFPARGKVDGPHAVSGVAIRTPVDRSFSPAMPFLLSDFGIRNSVIGYTRVSADEQNLAASSAAAATRCEQILKRHGSAPAPIRRATLMPSHHGPPGAAGDRPKTTTSSDGSTALTGTNPVAGCDPSPFSHAASGEKAVLDYASCRTRAPITHAAR